MRILITGGSGFIGQRLCEKLHAAGHQLQVVSRSPDRTRESLPSGADVRAAVADFADAAPEAVINLAGEPIAEGRWTEAKKRRIIDSRIETTRAVVSLCEKLETTPGVLVSASAVGYYGDKGDADVTEDTEPHDEFLHRICEQWEAEARKAEAHGVRVANPRIGLVLDAGGGMLKKMAPPFKFGLGGRLGDGRQYMPWIHREDMVRILEFLLTHDQCTGAYNASAPNPVTNAEFTKTLASHLNRPAIFPAPEFALKVAFGEMSHMLLTGAKMLPSRLEEAGFEFLYPTLDDALAEIYGG